jgi:CheY-like chemotaxis protein
MSVLIYVVEDDARSRRLLHDVLTFHGHRVQVFETGEAALVGVNAGIAHNDLPALVLLDIQLPAMNGFEVLRAMRARQELAGVKVVAVTASVMDHDRKRIRDEGFDEYLPKPVSLDALASLVADVGRKS